MLLTTHWMMVVRDQFTQRISGLGLKTGDVDGIAMISSRSQATSFAISTRGNRVDTPPFW